MKNFETPGKTGRVDRYAAESHGFSLLAFVGIILLILLSLLEGEVY